MAQPNHMINRSTQSTTQGWPTRVNSGCYNFHPFAAPIDKVAAWSWGVFARLCVELDLSCSLESYYKVNEKKYFIEYEGLYMICFKCGKAVVRDNADGGDRRLEVDKGKGISQETQAVNNRGAFQRKQTYGPWMVVQKQRRTRKQPSVDDKNVVGENKKGEKGQATSAGKSGKGKKNIEGDKMRYEVWDPG
ncbi:hypothetical protein PIB30_050726 [Stylosanthes scabra]|uniref:FLZ-type domain-containing protein n=1 Tax=Stylosanthes scabra TaxID=79078 RepID=A0ABU6XGU0_9FABA|nr:hypothetical protein [Stylosanthes scabra]